MFSGADVFELKTKALLEEYTIKTLIFQQTAKLASVNRELADDSLDGSTRELHLAEREAILASIEEAEGNLSEVMKVIYGPYLGLDAALRESNKKLAAAKCERRGLQDAINAKETMLLSGKESIGKRHAQHDPQAGDGALCVGQCQ